MKKLLIFFILLNVVACAQLVKIPFTLNQDTYLKNISSDTSRAILAEAKAYADSAILNIYEAGIDDYSIKYNIDNGYIYVDSNFVLQRVIYNGYATKAYADQHLYGELIYIEEGDSLQTGDILVFDQPDENTKIWKRERRTYFNSGTTSMGSSADSVVISHNVTTLTPSINNIFVTPTSDLERESYWITNVTSTTFTIKRSGVGASASFVWQVRY